MNEDNAQQEAQLKAQEIDNVGTWLNNVYQQVFLCDEQLSKLSTAKVFEEITKKCQVLDAIELAQSLFLPIHRLFVQLREGVLQSSGGTFKLRGSDDLPDYLISTGEDDCYRTTLCVTYLEKTLKSEEIWLREVCVIISFYLFLHSAHSTRSLFIFRIRHCFHGIVPPTNP